MLLPAIIVVYMLLTASLYEGCPDTENEEWTTIVTVSHVEMARENLYSVKFKTPSGCELSAYWYTARTPKPGLQILLKGRTNPAGDVEITNFVVLDSGKVAKGSKWCLARLGGGSWVLFRGEPGGFQFPDLGNRLETA